MLKIHLKLSLQTTLCLLLLLFLFDSCDEKKLRIDVSNVEVDLKIERWDSVWFNMTALGFRKFEADWQEYHPQFYKHYTEDILGLGEVGDSNLFNQIRRFVSDPSIAEVHAEVEKQFANLDALEAELIVAWKHFKYYFPEKEIPAHIAYEGGFNSPLALTENTVGIPLEMYLGSNSVYYDYLQLPLYLRKRMDVEHIPTEVLKAWTETEFWLDMENPTLLDEIIHQGKILYCLDAFFTYTEDSVKIAYSAEEMIWAKAHEANVWAHFIDNELLYTTETATIAKYTRDGPFTVDLVKESPARMGHYIGWQIVRSYMNRQEKIDLEGLMLESDSKKILKESKYKP